MLPAGCHIFCKRGVYSLFIDKTWSLLCRLPGLCIAGIQRLRPPTYGGKWGFVVHLYTQQFWYSVKPGRQANQHVTYYAFINQTHRCLCFHNLPGMHLLRKALVEWSLVHYDQNCSCCFLQAFHSQHDCQRLEVLIPEMVHLGCDWNERYKQGKEVALFYESTRCATIAITLLRNDMR